MERSQTKNTVRSLCLLVAQLGVGVRRWDTHTGTDGSVSSQCHWWEQRDWCLRLECLARRSPWEPVPCSVLAGRGFGCRGAARGCWPSVVAGLLCPFQAVTASRAAFRSPLPSAFLRAFSNGVPFPWIVPLPFCQQLLLRSVSLHSSVPSGVVVPPEVRRTFCSVRGLLARARRDSSAFWSCW